MGRSTKERFVTVSTTSCYSLVSSVAANHPSLPCSQTSSHFRVRTSTEHFRENINVGKFPVEMSELQIPPKQTRKRRSTEAMRKSEEARKKNALKPQRHSTRSVAFRHADDGMRKHQNDSASPTSLAVCSSVPSSAQPSIEIDNSDIWDFEAEIDLVREKFNELKTEQRHKIEALKTQILSDAINRNLIRCCRCRFFAAIDIKGLCADCFHTRCSECKHSGDLEADKYGLADAEKAKARE